MTEGRAGRTIGEDQGQVGQHQGRERAGAGLVRGHAAPEAVAVDGQDGDQADDALNDAPEQPRPIEQALARIARPPS